MRAAICARCVTRCSAIRSDDEIRRGIEKTRNVARFYRRLVPYDKEAFNAAKLIWDCVADIPPEHRVDLLDVLNGWDIEKLWQISATRYDDSNEISTPTIADDFPEDSNEFEGKASVPFGIFGWERFSKLLFLDSESYDTYGRLMLHVPLGDTLYPLYFRTESRQLRVPATGELAEVSMEYLNERTAQQLRLPEKWPVVSEPKFPFHGDLTEYLRPIGPGCYVGVGWREPRLDRNDLGRKFWTFILVKVSYTP